PPHPHARKITGPPRHTAPLADRDHDLRYATCPQECFGAHHHGAAEGTCHFLRQGSTRPLPYRPAPYRSTAHRALPPALCGDPSRREPPRPATRAVHQELDQPPQWLRRRHGAPSSWSTLGHHPYRVLQTGEGSLPPPLGGSTHHPLRGRSSSGVSPRFPLVRQQGTDRPPDRQRRPGRVGPGLGRRGVRLPEDHREPL